MKNVMKLVGVACLGALLIGACKKEEAKKDDKAAKKTPDAAPAAKPAPDATAAMTPPPAMGDAGAAMKPMAAGDAGGAAMAPPAGGGPDMAAGGKPMSAADEKEAMDIMNKASDDVCACKDAQCLTKVLMDVQPKLAKYEGMQPSDAGKKKAEEIGKKMQECVSKIQPPAGGAPGGEGMAPPPAGK